MGGWRGQRGRTQACPLGTGHGPGQPWKAGGRPWAGSGGTWGGTGLAPEPSCLSPQPTGGDPGLQVTPGRPHGSVGGAGGSRPGPGSCLGGRGRGSAGLSWPGRALQGAPSAQVLVAPASDGQEPPCPLPGQGSHATHCSHAQRWGPDFLPCSSPEREGREGAVLPASPAPGSSAGQEDRAPGAPAVLHSPQPGQRLLRGGRLPRACWGQVEAGPSQPPAPLLTAAAGLAGWGRSAGPLSAL